MVRLTEILKKEEVNRAHIQGHKPLFLDKLSSKSDGSTPLTIGTERSRSADTLNPESLYSGLLSVMWQVLADASNSNNLNLAPVKEKLNLLVDFVSRDDGALLKLIDRYDDLEDYLAVHGVNVCILSLEIGRGLNYDRPMLLELGEGAFLHDIGMLKIANILANKRPLYAAEYEEVKNHVIYGLEFLEKSGEPDTKRIAAIISQHHERIDASGYLQRLGAEGIDEYAQIVGLADVYEALVHSRPHRAKFVPFEHETIREIISNRGMFNPYILRIFLERLTRHPGYMLWLAADGVYQLLQRQDKPQKQPEVAPPIKPAGKKKYILGLGLLVVVLALIFMIIPHTITPQKEIFYPLGNSLNIAANTQPLSLAYNFINNTQDTPSVSLDLTGINLEGYHFLSFSSKLQDKKTNRLKYAALKISIENARKESANYYLEGISNRWQEFRIPLSYFDTIKDWSTLESISFILQPWNIEGKEGSLYIDDIHFFRKK